MGIEGVHDALIAALGATLAESNWVIDDRARRDVEGAPDLVFRSPEGSMFVAEVRVGGGADTAHFSTVAEVARYANLLGSQQGGRAVHGLLITDALTTPGVEEIAKGVDIQLLHVRPGDLSEPNQLARRLVAQIANAGAVSGD